jgi:tRNA uridine 5-carboxymethylaminomethyl modification enzyme
MTKIYPVLVVGGGHAGIEAAWAAAKFGEVALMIANPATLGRMPCNPAVGGPGKSQIVAEVQAMGGLMGRIADDTAIHTRILNASKGPAVHSLRVQNERDEYARCAQDYVFGNPNIEILRAEAADLTFENNSGNGVWTVTSSDGRHFYAQSVVIAAGTFMRAQTWYGRHTRPEGRQGEPPSRFLSGALERAGHVLRRFKTGTPPRVRSDSVAFAGLLEIPAEAPAHTFSGREGPRARQSPTWQTYTTVQTHQIVQENIHQSPMYAGDIEGLGPRYCPSIEDKIVKFAHHDRHLLFVEPDGIDTSEVYLQGFSSSLPPHIQDLLVRTLPGFEQAVIQRYAYAVEYDVVDSRELTLNLESRYLAGVFTAGQINGTSGYEEAAAQGLVAGTAAARRAWGLENHVLERESSYIGVMLDDLVFTGTDEPYRMMTSRVEHRLLVRQDNADERLTSLAHQWGLVDTAELERVQHKYARVAQATENLKRQKHQGVSGEQLLKRPEIRLEDLLAMGINLEPDLNRLEAEALEIRVKYEGYIRRSREQLEQDRKYGSRSLEGIDFHGIGAISKEARDKLSKAGPLTVAQASRIPGVRQGDLSALLIHLRQGEKARG